MHVTLRITAALLINMIPACSVSTTGTDGATVVYLERGRRGIVPCPPIESNHFQPEDIHGTYWYHGRLHSTFLLISYFKGTVAPQNGNPVGVYDIDRRKFSLVIENVSDADEGVYFYKVKPRHLMVHEGRVVVFVIVTPKDPIPHVIGCEHTISKSLCKVRLSHDDPEHNLLTCLVRYAKPRVEIRWLRQDGNKELVPGATTVVSPVVLSQDVANADLSWANNTYVTSVSVLLSSVDEGEKFVCQASGVALKNGSSTTVEYTRDPPPNEIDTGQLTDEEDVINFDVISDAVSCIRPVTALIELMLMAQFLACVIC